MSWCVLKLELNSKHVPKYFPQIFVISNLYCYKSSVTVKNTSWYSWNLRLKVRRSSRSSLRLLGTMLMKSWKIVTLCSINGSCAEITTGNMINMIASIYFLGSFSSEERALIRWDKDRMVVTSWQLFKVCIRIIVYVWAWIEKCFEIQRCMRKTWCNTTACWRSTWFDLGVAQMASLILNIIVLLCRII